MKYTTKPSQFDCGNKTALCTHRHDSSSSFKSVSPTDRISKFCSGVSFTIFHVSTDRVAHSIAMIGFCFSIGTSAFSEPWSWSWSKSFNKGSAPLPAKLRLTGVVPSTVLCSLHCAINAIKPNMNVIAVMIVWIRTAGMVLRRRIFVVHESRQSSCVIMLNVHVGWGSWRMNECCRSWDFLECSMFDVVGRDNCSYNGFISKFTRWDSFSPAREEDTLTTSSQGYEEKTFTSGASFQWYWLLLPTQP